jgi:hypothetical protein
MAEAQPVVIQVSSDGSHLQTESGQTVYLFYPQRLDPAHRFIPWGRDFPGYLVDWVLNWTPLVGIPKAGKGVNQENLSTIVRGGQPDKGQSQISYRGWWLYTLNGEAPNTQSPVPGLFQLVPADEGQLMLLVSPENVGDGAGYNGGP